MPSGMRSMRSCLSGRRTAALPSMLPDAVKNGSPCGRVRKSAEERGTATAGMDLVACGHRGRAGQIRIPRARACMALSLRGNGLRHGDDRHCEVTMRYELYYWPEIQ